MNYAFTELSICLCYIDCLKYFNLSLGVSKSLKGYIDLKHAIANSLI